MEYQIRIKHNPYREAFKAIKHADMSDPEVRKKAFRQIKALEIATTNKIRLPVVIKPSIKGKHYPLFDDLKEKEYSGMGNDNKVS
jgi:hypothetical protein